MISEYQKLNNQYGKFKSKYFFNKIRRQKVQTDFKATDYYIA